MVNDKGERVKEAGPSVPVEITGLAEVPQGGDIFNAVSDEKLARELVEQRKQKQKEEQFKSFEKVTLENLFSSLKEGELKELNIIVKADVQGSVEAVKQALEKLSNDLVKVRVLHSGVGAITKDDVNLANAFGAIIIGFNIRPTAKIKEVAEQEKVDIRFYDIIYKLVDDIKAAMSGMLSPDIKEVYLGQADVQQVFSVPKVGNIAGCMVTDGFMRRNAKARLLRDGVVVAETSIASLRREKDDVTDVREGYECGLTLSNYSDIHVGDVVETYEMVEKPRD